MISPNQLKNLRSRYGSAGNKDDRFDAYVLADTLRTDRARLRPLTARQHRHPSPCGRPAGPVKTSSGTASPWPISSARTCRPRCPASSGCSATSTARSA
ncbi:MAG: transposase [Geodermatophilaceae bacterium]